jgi:hypothetical protein
MDGGNIVFGVQGAMRNTTLEELRKLISIAR